MEVNSMAETKKEDSLNNEHNEKLEPNKLYESLLATLQSAKENNGNRSRPENNGNRGLP
jgi:hypothetical protein